MGAYVKLDEAALAEVLQGPNGPVHADLTRRVLRVHASAVKNCRVDTGRARASLRWSIGHDSKGLVGIVGGDVEYLGYLNDGTRFMAGDHFLTNALKEAL